jgi:pimeloyl-ACP methyl ester carboxylesterase
MIVLGIIVGLLILAAVIAAVTFTSSVAGKVTRGFPPTGVFIETSAGRVHVVDKGAGPPIVMIHGLGGQIGNFSYGLMDRLTDRCRAIAIDRPGSGHSDPMPSDFKGVRRHASVVAEVMTQLGLPASLIVGHSLGGAIALALAVDRPDLVRGVALISPLTSVLEEPPAAFRGLNLRHLWQRRALAHSFAIPLSILRRKVTLDAIFGPEDAPADFPTRGLGLLSLRPQAFIGASTDMAHANDDLPWLKAHYPAIRAPISILFAGQDRILDPQVHGQGLADIAPTATLTLTDGGHMIPVTVPERVADFISDAAQEVFAK